MTQSANQLIVYRGVCKTALATPGLLKIVETTWTLENYVQMMLKVKFKDGSGSESYSKAWTYINQKDSSYNIQELNLVKSVKRKHILVKISKNILQSCVSFLFLGFKVFKIIFHRNCP